MKPANLTPDGPTKLCLWCEHMSLDTGMKGYSELTPGQSFRMSCQLRHWEYDQDLGEVHYRSCLLHAITCRDYRFNPLIQVEIGAATR